jgi:pantothenate synthetase
MCVVLCWQEVPNRPRREHLSFGYTARICSQKRMRNASGTAISARNSVANKTSQQSRVEIRQLDHLHLKHDIDKTTGERKSIRGESVKSSQPSISDYQDMRSIIFSRRLDSAVTRGMSEWIVLFVTVLSVAGGIALLIYCYLCGPQDLSWVPHMTL